MTPAGRPPRLIDGRMASELPPTKRGYRTVTVPKAVYDELTAYQEANKLPSRAEAIRVLLERAVAVPEPPAVAQPPIPWDRIEEALIEQLGYARRQDVRNAIETVKAAQE